MTAGVPRAVAMGIKTRFEACALSIPIHSDCITMEASKNDSVRRTVGIKTKMPCTRDWFLHATRERNNSLRYR
jgi:hypothetical protein